ncbi:hypothetical protein [Burkholderia glumae]|uniref:hypothetical protein n=1 Tax=Burkholderia glumae TaxID=337 RepID=UPI0020B3158C|nr:hypothetical protein [Burkholderia glumae]
MQVVEARLDQAHAQIAPAQEGGRDVHRDRGGIDQVDLVPALQRAVLAVQPIERLDEGLLGLVLRFRGGLVPEIRQALDDTLLRRALALVGMGVGQVEAGLQRRNLVLRDVFLGQGVGIGDVFGKDVHDLSLSGVQRGPAGTLSCQEAGVGWPGGGPANGPLGRGRVSRHGVAI